MAARTQIPHGGHPPAAPHGRRRRDLSLAALDSETGLPARIQLRADLDAAASEPRTLLLVELHAADGYVPVWLEEDPELPRRSAAALAGAIGSLGQLYRLEGLSFALLGPAGVADDGALMTASRALAGAADEPSATVMHGQAHLPDDGAGAAALAVALRRLRARARRHGLSTERQVRDVLVALLAQRRAGGSPLSMPNVASHAVAVGRKLGLSYEQLDDVVRAAELQDIGKLVIPESILNKREALSDQEWAIVRTHPLIAERVIAAAPALSSVSRLVRSCTERWDGSGYPDGLRGDAIPLGSRIIAVCVAFDAMTAPRPYRAPLRLADAYVELWRCAGSQFDPAVVAMFCSATAELEASETHVASRYPHRPRHPRDPGADNRVAEPRDAATTHATGRRTQLAHERGLARAAAHERPHTRDP